MLPLVVMEPRGKDASALIAMEEIKNQWLTNFLVNPRQNDYTNPNDGIMIKMFEDGNGDTNSNSGRRYGKRART